MMRLEFFVLPALVVVGLTAWLLVPDQLGYAQLRFSDGQVNAALEDNVMLRMQSPRDAETGFQLARSQLAMGLVDEAAYTLETLISQGSGEPMVYLTLADIYTSLGRQSESVDLLLAMPLDQVKSSTAIQLLGWLRYSGRNKEERALLEWLEAAELASDMQTLRLAFLRLANGDYVTGLASLQQLDDAGKLTGAHGRHTLLALLLETGKVGEARQRLNNWKPFHENFDIEENAIWAFEERGLRVENK